MKLSVAKTTHYHSFFGGHVVISSTVNYDRYSGDDFLNVEVSSHKKDNKGAYTFSYYGRQNNRAFKAKKDVAFPDYESAWRAAWQKLLAWR